ncbi:hypothetical protein L227DRAFT_628864 [Lentinus tigrinus ALCF2SS1-6]|uniref:DUF6533 domain-containing protein n=1 Tax=Lentinus tigrinus ALCF2SS1-6 TaxID=1328759 RepID=A0A5C2S768_9APHY|nr:hypothetical protein L227DRAFT_628864 [Lentinus tigrinus ALCF2SS1-6]
MSSDTDVAATLALFDTIYTETYCGMAAAVLFIYDACVTFDREVAYFWNAKRKVASLLFFANRWISMTLYIMWFVDSFATFSSDKLYVFRFSGSFIGSTAIHPRSKAYVLSKSKLLGLLVLVLSLAPVASNLVQYGYDLAGEILPPFGCLYISNITGAINLKSGSSNLYDSRRLIQGTVVIFVARIPLIVADILLTCITWTKLSTRDALRDLRQSKRVSLSDILFRGGTIYFAYVHSIAARSSMQPLNRGIISVLFILNVLHLILSATAVAIAGSGQQSEVTTFTGPITAILISHFLLELQEANQTVIRIDPDDPLRFSRDPYDYTPSFISSLGAVVSPALPIPHDDDTDWHIGLGRPGPGEEVKGAGQSSDSQTASSSFSASA